MMEATIERRATPRHRVLKGARIAFSGNGVECTVRNLSSGGAAIDLAYNVSLPPSFMLVLETDRVMHRCRPVWSNARRIGVAFD